MNLNYTKEFSAFIDSHILPSQNDIQNLADPNRIHVQKLIYTNLVDRFDAMIDNTLLANCRLPQLADKATSPLKDNLTEESLIKLLLLSNDDLQILIDNKLKNSLRFSVLNKRHSLKLNELLTVIHPRNAYLKLPQVDRITGRIHDKTPPKDNKIPTSICGYADWLYSRRNAIVHGSGKSTLLENDMKKLNEIYGAVPTKNTHMTFGSINTATAFYKDIVRLISETNR